LQRNRRWIGDLEALYDKIYREDVLEEAWEEGAARTTGHPESTGQSFEHIEEVLGVADFPGADCHGATRAPVSGDPGTALLDRQTGKT